MYAGDIMELPIVTKKQGKVVNEEIVFTSLNPEIIEVDHNNIIGRGLGTGIIRCALKRNETIYIDIPVEVSSEHTEQTIKLFIEGSDYIEWNTKQEYKLSNNENVIFNEPIVKSKIRYDYTITDNSIIIEIKDKYSGTIELSCETEQGKVEKTVYIRTV